MTHDHGIKYQCARRDMPFLSREQRRLMARIYWHARRNGLMLPAHERRRMREDFAAAKRDSAA